MKGIKYGDGGSANIMRRAYVLKVEAQELLKMILALHEMDLDAQADSLTEGFIHG